MSALQNNDGGMPMVSYSMEECVDKAFFPFRCARTQPLYIGLYR